MIATVTLNPAVDYTVSLADALKTGEVNRTRNARITAGGKGINVSYILHQLHENTRIYGFLAGNTGDMIASQVSSLDLDADWIWLTRQNNRINVKIETSEAVTELNGKGIAAVDDDYTMLLEKLRIYGENDIIVLAGSIPAGAQPTQYGQIMRALAGSGVRFAVDAEGDALAAALPCRPYVVKPNLPELCGFFGVSITDWQAAMPYLTRLQAMGARNVLLSMAEEGAMLLDENRVFWRLSAPHGKMMNTVGAGDSMLAGFLAATEKHLPYSETLRWGVAAGSATAYSEWLADETKIKELLTKTDAPIQIS